ncbi:hypothetical protein CMI47_19115 [Candidatus Pacearchaeota archaeon]|nr:hypothetical protein [Candidatus Pacearchaeota archaeon]
MIQKILIDITYLDMGIVPPPSTHEDRNSYSKGLSSLAAIDQRKARRKFRKIYKKARIKRERIALKKGTRSWYNNKRSVVVPNKKQRDSIVNDEILYLHRQFGEPGCPPTPNQKNARRSLVYEHILNSMADNE